MKILIDLQQLQTPSRERGIGRYTWEITKQLIIQANQHEIYILLNDSLPWLQQTQQDLAKLLPANHIILFSSLSNINVVTGVDNKWRNETAQMLRESFLENLAADILFIPSLFEGSNSNAITTNRKLTHTKTVITVHDLIPLIYGAQYLSDTKARSWYMHKIPYLIQADALVSVSDASKRDCIKHLDFAADKIFNSYEAASTFKKIIITEADKQKLFQEIGITDKFIFYLSGPDYRKNNDKLIKAFAQIGDKLLSQYQLIISYDISALQKQQLIAVCKQYKLRKNSVIFTNRITDEQLLQLYNLCSLFVFPALYEGFGLPILEAMNCGAPVIGSNTSSIPEVIGNPQALFDPSSSDSIAAKITQVLTDKQLLNQLLENSKRQVQKFSWEKSAQEILTVFETINFDKVSINQSTFIDLIDLYTKTNISIDTYMDLDPQLVENYVYPLLLRLERRYKLLSGLQTIKHPKPNMNYLKSLTRMIFVNEHNHPHADFQKIHEDDF